MHTNQPRVLVCDPIHADGLQLLRRHAAVDVRPGLAQAELEELIGEYDAVIVRSATRLPAAVIARGERLRAIGRAGAGLDGIDVLAARGRGVEVLNAPDANTLAVAEHTFALLLALARQVVAADQGMKAGRWEKARLMGRGLAGRTLGIVGFGRIGRQVAQRARAFDMRVLVNQPRLTPEMALEWGVEHCDLPTLLRESDVMTLHVPLRPENIGLIGARELMQMRPGAFLINTARGQLVDETALLEALESGRLAGAALDVFAHEPAANTAITAHPRVLATPHIAASTEDAQRQAALTVAERVLAALRRQGAAETLALRFVPLERVTPHESYDARRVRALAQRIAEEGRLSNPPVVVEWGERYVVLDGATRVQALKHLGLPYAVVQVVSSNDAHLQAHTWSHIISGQSLEGLLGLLRDVPGLQLSETAPEYLPDRLKQGRALAALYGVDRSGVLLNALPDDPDSWLATLNALVERYTAWGTVERTLLGDLGALRAQYPRALALVVFPQLPLEHILRLAAGGQVLPAGLTRFVIPGRILRLHVPLERLRGDEPIERKNDWLDHLVQEKLAQRRVRYYQEPVVLLDE
jgi:phosphoglycerate dehydrogenase-like enzyme